MRSTYCTLFLGSAALALAGLSCGSSQIAVDAAPEPPPKVAAAVELPGDEPKDDKPVFPTDRGGLLLADLLAPPPKGSARLDATTSPRRPPARDWQEPALLPGPSNLPPPQPAFEKPRKRQRPADLPEPLPLFDQLASPHLPESPHLAAGARIRVPSPDVNQPMPLPILAQQVPDRAALDDPTLEASLAIALALAPPLRSLPAPFLRLVLPNPFEHRETGRLRQPPPEDPMPVTATPRVPGKP